MKDYKDMADEYELSEELRMKSRGVGNEKTKEGC